jgi:hypothetical protein
VLLYAAILEFVSDEARDEDDAAVIALQIV